MGFGGSKDEETRKRRKSTHTYTHAGRERGRITDAGADRKRENRVLVEQHRRMGREGAWGAAGGRRRGCVWSK